MLAGRLLEDHRRGRVRERGRIRLQLAREQLLVLVARDDVLKLLLLGSFFQIIVVAFFDFRGFSWLFVAFWRL